MFATVDDLARVLQAEFDQDQMQTAQLLLGLATGRIQGWTNQTIAPVTPAEVEFWSVSTVTLWLPHPPAIPVNVFSVELNGVELDDSAWRIDRLHGLRLVGRRRWFGDIVVDYEHGFDTVPDDVKDAALKLSVRMMTNPTYSQSVKLEGFSESFQTGSATSEQAVLAGLDRYRLAVPA